jgi:hypothetical protein
VVIDGGVGGLEEAVVDVAVHHELQLRRGCHDGVLDRERVEAGVHDDWGEYDSQYEEEADWPYKWLVPGRYSQLLLSQYLSLALGPVHSGIDVLELHPVEEGQRGGGGGPVGYLFELPEEGHSREEKVDVVVDPVVALHEGVSAFVAVEPVLDLQSRYHEVDQVEQQEEREVVVGLAADRHLALRNDALLQPARGDVEVNEEVYEEQQRHVEGVLDDEQVVEPTQRGQLLHLQGHVLRSVLKGKAEEKVLELLVEPVDEVQSHDHPVHDHDDHLEE